MPLMGTNSLESTGINKTKYDQPRSPPVLVAVLAEQRDRRLREGDPFGMLARERHEVDHLLGAPAHAHAAHAGGLIRRGGGEGAGEGQLVAWHMTCGAHMPMSGGSKALTTVLPCPE
jgi:hypothetical protein